MSLLNQKSTNLVDLRPALLLVLAGFIFSGSIFAQSQVELPKTIPACPADYLTDGLLASDGSIWVASEGKGLYRYFPNKTGSSEKDWMEGSYYTGLPDTVNFYALAEDKQGRIWAGTDNKGVAVFNGQTWKTYDRENALIGERVFDIAVSPKTGDVAVATSGGISIYQPGKKDWLTLTRAEGLTEDQIKSLDYDIAGDLWIAYSCGGISQLSGKENYKILQTVQTKWYWDQASGARQPLEASGEGLPSNLCEAILTLPNGGVIVGTTSGLGWLTNRKTDKWKFLRGQDYHDKNMGLIKPPATTAPRERMEHLLAEDYITSLAQAKQGIWVGFREKGAVLLDPATMKKKGEAKFPANITQPWVTSILPFSNGSAYATTYGFGFVKISEAEGSSPAKLKVTTLAQMPPHPEAARILSAEEIAKELENRDAQFKAEDTPVIFWKEDWATQGDWCERYGAHYAALCATDQPRDDKVTSLVRIDLRRGIGPNKLSGGDLYLKFFQGDITDNSNILHNPNTGTRVAAQWIDRSKENYQPYYDGPDIWTAVNLPEGKYEVALYFYNYGEGDESRQGNRDYLVEVRQGNGPLDEGTSWDDEIREVMGNPVLARARVSDFKGSGVYKSFFVNKGGRYYFRVVNNYSPCTMLNAVLVNQLNPATGVPESTEHLMRVAYADMPPRPEKIKKEEKQKYQGVLKSWNKAFAPSSSREYLSRNGKVQNALYRLMKTKDETSSIASNWRWYLKLWARKEHQDFEEFMRKCWLAKQDNYVVTRSEEFFPYSPGVIPFSPREIRIMKYMGIDWKDYLPEAKKKPVMSPMDFKEKCSRINDDEYKRMEKDFFDKQIKSNEDNEED